MSSDTQDTQNIQAVIFDMDGVILDSESICDDAWERAAPDFALAASDVSAIINRCRGTSTSDTIAIIKQTLGSDFDAEGFFERASFYFKEIERTQGIPLKPYAKEILQYLKGRYKIALASSTHKAAVVRQLTAAGVIDFFETLTTGDMVTHSKPEPEIYQKACASIGVEAQNCIAVEDSPNGIRSAHGAGMRAVCVVDRAPIPPEIASLCRKVCRSLNELKEFL